MSIFDSIQLKDFTTEEICVLLSIMILHNREYPIKNVKLERFDEVTDLSPTELVRILKEMIEIMNIVIFDDDDKEALNDFLKWSHDIHDENVEGEAITPPDIEHIGNTYIERILSYIRYKTCSPLPLRFSIPK
jgi:hypothetical protein